jgi:hypothetical protein
MTHRTNDRDRLMLAFAELNRHGILARPSLATTAEQGHDLLRADLAARHPHGLGSYVFWTQADEQRFDPTGHLTAALSLHCSSEEVATAVTAVCRGARLDPQPMDRTAAVHVAPAAPPRAATPRRAAAPSPWRWLGARVPVIGS